MGDLGSVHVAQPVAAKADPKDKTCFNCGKKGHLAENCPEPRSVAIVARRVIQQKIAGRSILIRSQRLNQKPRASLPSLVEEAKVGKRWKKDKRKRKRKQVSKC